YNLSVMKSLPSEYIEKYFIEMKDSTSKKDMYKIKNEIKNMVELKKHDMLLEELPKNLDLIICRNVVIYFKDEAKNELYKNFNSSLKTNGFLFVGNTEQLLNSNELGFKATNVFFFEKIK
ncbi:MAG: chemotaxis protein CheR, partial [Romboutsia sp.]|nr:chemotaxis protein CheR [Romboutsia sp.]